MRAKTISKPDAESSEPSVRGVGNETLSPLKGGSPDKTASESGIDAKTYGARVLKVQSNELQTIFKAARVRDALVKQGYQDHEISSALKELNIG